MAGKQVQRRRGSTTEHGPFIGALGEVTVDITKKVEVVHDGVTPGGFPMASARDIQALSTSGSSTQAEVDALEIVVSNNAAVTVTKDTATGVAHLPKGTTAQRPASPQAGDIRYNTQLLRFEGYSNGIWGAIGAGATGGGNDHVFYENDQTITTNYTLTANTNAMTAGKVTIANGVTVTVPDGATWSIV